MEAFLLDIVNVIIYIMAQKIATLLVIVSILIAIVTCIVTIFIPEIRLFLGFDNTNSIPVEETSKIKCIGENFIANDENKELKGLAICELNLQPNEIIAGTAELFSDEKSDGSHLVCAVFVIQGPIKIRGLKLMNANWSFYENLSSEDVSKITQAKETEIQRKEGICFQKRVDYFTTSTLVKVSGHQEEGTRFDIILTGNYLITLKQGAYSPFPFEGMSDKEWRTLTYIYKNQQVSWKERVKAIPPDDPNVNYFEPSKTEIIGSIGEWEVTTFEEAESLGKIQSPLTLDLKSGDFLIFVAIDDLGWYFNPSANRGELYIEIKLVGQ